MAQGRHPGSSRRKMRYFVMCVILC
jgi:hypothetical protein